MANYSAIKAAVNAYIKANGKKEITGHILNSVLNATIDSLGRYFQFAGGAMPTDDPGTPDQNVCYLAGEPGVYTNFGGITIENEEVALLFWDGEWTKQKILIGIQEVEASVDNQVGTPSVDVSYSGGQLVLTFHNIKGEQGIQGEQGAAAGFGTIAADINEGVGTPGVSVETSGDNTAKNLMFHFTNLKGETGVTSVVATIDDTSGTPSCQVSLVNGVLTLAFSGLKGLKGDTGVSADYPITIYNGLDSDATDQALAAAQGKVLDGKINQLGQEVDDLERPVFGTEKAFSITGAGVVPMAFHEGFIYTIYNEGANSANFSTRETENGSTLDGVFIIPAGSSHTFKANYDANYLRISAASSGKVLVKTFQAQINEVNADMDELSLETTGQTISTPSNTHVPFDVKSGTTYRFTNLSSSAITLYLRNGQSSTGQLLVGVIAVGGYKDVNPQSNYNYLYLYSSNTVQFSLGVQTYDTLNFKIDAADVERRAYASINALALGDNSALSFKGFLGSNGQWTVSSGVEHRLIIIKANDAIKITADDNNNVYYALLNRYEVPVNGYFGFLCSGTQVVTVSAGGSSEVTAPQDARFLYISTKYSGIDVTPSSVLINGTECVTYLKQSVKSRLNDLSTQIDSIDDNLGGFIDGALITLKGTSASKLTLNVPILLSQDGDEVEINVDNLNAEDTSGFAFSNSGLSTNSYYSVQLSHNKAGIRATDGTWLFQSKAIPDSAYHTIRIVFANSKILTYIDGSLVSTYNGQKDIRIASFGDGGRGTYGYWSGTIVAIKHNGNVINLYKQQKSDVIEQIHYIFDALPKGVLIYNATTKVFEFYSKNGDTNKYFMFRVRLDQDDSDLVYLKEWRWSYGAYCEYNNGIFTPIAVTAIDAENEMAMRFANTVDYTGGIHGDERIDVSPSSFVKFFADGELISDAEMANNFTKVCSSFAYMQLSTLHQTSSVSGEFVSGHPIIAMHYKQNTFQDCRSHLENRIFFITEQNVTIYHAGMMCVGKDAASYAILPNYYEVPQLTGTDEHYYATNRKRPRVDFWNPAKGLRCYVEGRMIEGINDGTEINALTIWDRNTDTKYYRLLSVSDANAKVFHENDVIINEQDVVYY